MKAYKQQVLSAPAKVLVMKKQGRKMVPAAYITKSGQVKNRYVTNPLSHQIKEIKHKATQNHDTKIEV
jgi:hypothetical protein